MNPHEVLLAAIQEISSLLKGYSIENVHRAIFYSAIMASIRKRGIDQRLLKPYEENLPRPLVYKSRRDLTPLFAEIIDILERKLEEKAPVIVNEANIKRIVQRVKQVFKHVDYVLVYDCMSLNEFLLVAGVAKSKGLSPTIPSDLILLNPLGLTRYVTSQLPEMGYRGILREFAHLLATELGAWGYDKNAYIDLKVHEKGSMGIENYIINLNITNIVDEIIRKASKGTVLVTADHGYDVIYNPIDNYLFITHGYGEPVKKEYKPLLLLSRFSFFLKISPGLY